MSSLCFFCGLLHKGSEIWSPLCLDWGSDIQAGAACLWSSSWYMFHFPLTFWSGEFSGQFDNIVLCHFQCPDRVIWVQCWMRGVSVYEMKGKGPQELVFHTRPPKIRKGFNPPVKWSHQAQVLKLAQQAPYLTETSLQPSEIPFHRLHPSERVSWSAEANEFLHTQLQTLEDVASLLTHQPFIHNCNPPGSELFVLESLVWCFQWEMSPSGPTFDHLVPGRWCCLRIWRLTGGNTALRGRLRVHSPTPLPIHSPLSLCGCR